MFVSSQSKESILCIQSNHLTPIKKIFDLSYLDKELGFPFQIIID